MLTKAQFIIVAIVPLLFAITLHEAAHGWIANKLGDSTALMLGRVTLNPIKHIDLIGTILVPAATLFLGGFIFGWAKPVPVSWQQLRNPRRDMALVALAGPGANLLMACLWAAIGKISMMTFGSSAPQSFMHTLNIYLHNAARFGILINCILMLLNLLPIPPLDGSRVVSSLLPNDLSRAYNRIEPFGIFILLGLLVVGALQFILWPPVQYLAGWIAVLFGI